MQTGMLGDSETLRQIWDGPFKDLIPNLRQTGHTLADWLKAREELHQFFTGETIVLKDAFILTEEELAATNLMPAFRPAGATNRMAVDWKKKMGVSVYEENVEKGGVMMYKNSKGLQKPELYLINRSINPDEDTLGDDNAKSPDGLIQMLNKLWLGLFGWCDADTFYFAMTGKHLDPNTMTWFPHDRLPGGGVAGGYWNVRRVRFCWDCAGGCDSRCGARSAKKVPLKPKTLLT